MRMPGKQQNRRGNSYSQPFSATLWMGVVCLLLVILGFAIHGGWDSWEYRKRLDGIEEERGRILNGMYIYNSNNLSTTKEFVQSRDERGDWVCINVAYEMTYPEAYKTCVHECSHKAFSEIYAEDCESDPLKCLETLNGE